MRLKGMDNIVSELKLKLKELKAALHAEEHENVALNERANKVS